jgi:hypothetical protein
MRAPKLRGFKNPFRVEYQVVNLDKLAELYPKGGDVTVADLVDKGAVRKNERVKVLGNGDIQVKLTSRSTRSPAPLSRRSSPPAARSSSPRHHRLFEPVGTSRMIHGGLDRLEPHTD